MTPETPREAGRGETAYESRVEQMAAALHQDCELEWDAIAVVHPGRLLMMHMADAHYGQAHDLVRRIWPGLDTAAPAPGRPAAEGLREALRRRHAEVCACPFDGSDPGCNLLMDGAELAALAAADRAERGGGELEHLRTALWQCGVESGMDTDGDTGPEAMVAGMGDERFGAAIVEHVRQLRGAYDECLSEPAAADRAERGLPLDVAWAEAEAALPEGWQLLAGRAIECKSCPGYWATASIGGRYDDGRPRLIVVSSETGRPRGEHHDATPAAALHALAVRLAADPQSPTDG